MDLARAEVPETVEGVLALREQRGHVTPLRPVVEGGEYCVWHSKDCIEWLVHPIDGRRMLADGVVVDGVKLRVTLEDALPTMGGWIVRAWLRA